MYQGTLNVLSLVNMSTIEVVHYFNSLWQAEVPRLHSWASFPLYRASDLRFAIQERYYGQTVTLSLWHLGRNFPSRP